MDPRVDGGGGCTCSLCLVTAVPESRAGGRAGRQLVARLGLNGCGE